MSSSDALRYLSLAGPTACGKTAVALALAESLRGSRPIEIVSIDSALIYREMDIGTAKPTAEELAQVPHHLIDIVDPLERYSAARFVADATAAIADIRSRGATPLLVGGTMLYLKALLEGMDDMPAIPPEVRAELDARMKALGLADDAAVVGRRVVGEHAADAADDRQGERPIPHLDDRRGLVRQDHRHGRSHLF